MKYRSIKRVKNEFFTKKFLQYFVTGLCAFAIDTIILYLVVFFALSEQENTNIILGIVSVPKLFSGSIGAVFSFNVNRIWAMKSVAGNIRNQVLKMIVVYLGGIVLGAIIYSIYFNINEIISELLNLNEQIEFTHYQPLLSNGLTTGTMMILNFLLYKYVVFK